VSGTISLDTPHQCSQGFWLSLFHPYFFIEVISLVGLLDRASARKRDWGALE
jgi:hypothetical protein